MADSLAAGAQASPSVASSPNPSPSASAYQEVAPLASRLGWRLELDNPSQCRLVRGPLTLQLEWGRFAAVIQQCDLLLSMTGTAAEQCVGLGKPVLQLEGRGPQFTAGFADAQRRIVALKVGELHAEEASFILDRVEKLNAGGLSIEAARQQIRDELTRLAAVRGK